MTQPSQPLPFLIVGFGIAGATLGWQFRQRGIPFEVVEPGSDTAASRVAPGIINPLAGKRLKPSWRVEDQLPAALRMYRDMEAAFGQTFFHPTPILRIIKDSRQREFFEQRTQDPRAQPYIGKERAPNGLGPNIRDPFGSFEARGSGYLDTARMTDCFRDELRAQGRLHETCFDHSSLDLQAEEPVWQARRYRAVVFCEGFSARANPFFAKLPFNPAKGEMLDLRLTGPNPDLPDMIINRSKWLLPLGGDRYRAGASYSWDPLDTMPTAEAREQILEMLHEFLDLRFEVLDQRAGVRPIIADYRPVLGTHPRHASLAIFNGLGSKGVLSSPWLSDMLAQSLLGETHLDPEVDVRRFASL